MELILSGLSLLKACELIGLKSVPQPILTYIFCCPGLDCKLRCLPRMGGYLDQDHIDMQNFMVIEGRIKHWHNRQSEKLKR